MNTYGEVNSLLQPLSIQRTNEIVKRLSPARNQIDSFLLSVWTPVSDFLLTSNTVYPFHDRMSHGGNIALLSTEALEVESMCLDACTNMRELHLQLRDNNSYVTPVPNRLSFLVLLLTETTDIESELTHTSPLNVLLKVCQALQTIALIRYALT